MNIRRFVKKSIDNQKKLFIILIAISFITAISAFLVQRLLGESSVYRAEFEIELTSSHRQSVNIKMADMPVSVSAWSGNSIKIECVAELPLIIDQTETEILIRQDESFAISIFTLDLFRYNVKVFLPVGVEFREVNIVSIAGEIAVNGYFFKTEKVAIESKSGDIDVNGNNCIYTIKSKSGNVFVDTDYLERLVLIKTESGNIKVTVPDYYKNKTESKLRAESETGIVEIIEKTDFIPKM